MKLMTTFTLLHPQWLLYTWYLVGHQNYDLLMKWDALNYFKNNLVSNIYHSYNNNNNFSKLKYPLSVSTIFSVTTTALKGKGPFGRKRIVFYD